MDKIEIKCPHCNSKEIVKRGYFQTAVRGRQQRYYCKSCNKKFISRDPFYRMRNTPQKITLCLDLFYRGVSTRKVQEHLQAFYPHNSSWVSIYSWILKYSKLISRFTNKLKLTTGKEVQFDEIEYHRRKSHKTHAGIDKNWFIDSIDTETRFMVASNYYKARGKKEIKQIMNTIKTRTEKESLTVTMDGLMTYKKVIKKVFGYRNLKSGLITHNQVNASKGEGFNYKIERLHNTLRQRTKIFRGFHGSVDSANAIMKGLEIYYNFIRNHMAINCCPYELAIPELKGKLGVNKWLDLINLASQKN